MNSSDTGVAFSIALVLREDASEREVAQAIESQFGDSEKVEVVSME